MAKLKLSDVDGTTPGRAALVHINLEDPLARDGFMQTVYVEGEYNCTNPWRSCEGLQRSIGGDWPNHHIAIIANARALYLKWAEEMPQLLPGTDGYSPAEYLEVK